MVNELDPIVGNWYRHLDKGQTFRVVDIDAAAGVIEIQHFDGDIEQIDADAWPDTDIEAAEEPEDWTGPIDEIDADALDYSETDMSDADWRGAVEDAHAADGEEWQDTRPEEERDEWAEGDAPEEIEARDLTDEVPTETEEKGEQSAAPKNPA